MPNKERLQLLVDELYSQRLKQSRGRLRTETGFCCLGVACEIFHRETGVGTWMTRIDGLNFRVDDDYSDTEYYMPLSVFEWFDLQAKDIEFSFLAKPRTDFDDAMTVSAARLNDWYFSFEQIADCIAYEFNLNIPEVAHA